MLNCKTRRTNKILSGLNQLWHGYFDGKPAIEALIFFVTYKCNFRCNHCFYVYSMDEAIDNQGKELCIEEIEKISFSLGKIARLMLSGGEPFLREDLARICEIFYRQNRVSDIHLPTNGFYTDKICQYTYKIMENCPDVNLTISLPLDGFEETHDEIKGTKGSFKKVLHTIDSLAALKKRFKNLKLYIITVVNNKNIDEIIRLSEFVKNNLLVDGHGTSPMRGKPYNRNLFPPSPDEWNRLSKELAGYYWYWNMKRGNNRLKTFLSTNKLMYLNRVYMRVLKGERLPFICQAGKLISVLEPNGDVRLCELTEIIGNVRSHNYDLKRILSSDKAKELLKEIDKCSCIHPCFLDPSIKMNPFALFSSYLLGK